MVWQSNNTSGLTSFTPTQHHTSLPQFWMILTRCHYSRNNGASPLLHRIHPYHMLFTSIIDLKQRGCQAEWEMMQEMAELIEGKSGNITKKSCKGQTFKPMLESHVFCSIECMSCNFWRIWLSLNQAVLRNMDKQTNTKWAKQSAQQKISFSRRPSNSISSIAEITSDKCTINHQADRDQLKAHSVSLMTQICQSLRVSHGIVYIFLIYPLLREGEKRWGREGQKLSLAHSPKTKYCCAQYYKYARNKKKRAVGVEKPEH